MKITCYLRGGAFTDWQEPDNFNLVQAIPMWRSAGYIQAPGFYINMLDVVIITTDASNVNFQHVKPKYDA